MERQKSKSVLEAVQDPLLRDLPLPYQRTFYPYGAPLRVASNVSAILDLAAVSFSRFRPRLQTAELMNLEVIVAGPDQGPVPVGPPVYMARDHLVTITGDARHFATIDFEGGKAYCWITPAMLADPAALRHFYLDACGFSLATEKHYAPVHAACVAWKGRGFLLCGQSEAGKSSLAYACARAGLSYVSDDGTFLLRSADQSGLTVVGNSTLFRLRPSAADLFPELSGFLPVRRANGKMSIEVDSLELLPGANLADETPIRFLVFLNRAGCNAETSPRFLPFPREAALEQLHATLRFGRESTRREQRECLRRLVDASSVFEFRYGSPETAAEALRQLAETEVPPQ